MITELDCLEQKEGNAGNVAPGDAPRWGVTSWVSDSKTALDIDRGEELVQGKDRERMWDESHPSELFTTQTRSGTQSMGKPCWGRPLVLPKASSYN